MNVGGWTLADGKWLAATWMAVFVAQAATAGPRISIKPIESPKSADPKLETSDLKKAADDPSHKYAFLGRPKKDQMTKREVGQGQAPLQDSARPQQLIAPNGPGIPIPDKKQEPTVEGGDNPEESGQAMVHGEQGPVEVGDKLAATAKAEPVGASPAEPGKLEAMGSAPAPPTPGYENGKAIERIATGQTADNPSETAKAEQAPMADDTAKAVEKIAAGDSQPQEASRAEPVAPIDDKQNGEHSQALVNTPFHLAAKPAGASNATGTMRTHVDKVIDEVHQDENQTSSGCSYRVFFALPCNPETSEQQLHLILTSGGGQCAMFKLLAKDCQEPENEEDRGLVTIPSHSPFSPLLMDSHKRKEKDIELFLGELMMGGEDLPEAMTTTEGRNQFIEELVTQLATFDESNPAANTGPTSKSGVLEQGNVSEVGSTDVAGMASGVKTNGPEVIQELDKAQAIRKYFSRSNQELRTKLQGSSLPAGGEMHDASDVKVVTVLRKLINDANMEELDVRGSAGDANRKAQVSDVVKAEDVYSSLGSTNGGHSGPGWKSPGWKAGKATAASFGGHMEDHSGDGEGFATGKDDPTHPVGKGNPELPQIPPELLTSRGAFSSQPIPVREPHSEGLEGSHIESKNTETESRMDPETAAVAGDDLKAKINKAVQLGFTVGFKTGMKKAKAQCQKELISQTQSSPGNEDEGDPNDDVMDILKYLMTSKLKKEVQGVDHKEGAIKKANWYLTNMPNGKQKIFLFQ